MGLFGKKTVDPPADAELLTVGAVLLNLNSMKPQNLRPAERGKAEQILAQAWGVDDGSGAMDLIKHFQSGADCKGLDAALKADNLDDDQRAMLDYLKGRMIGSKRYGEVRGKKYVIISEDVDKITTTVAWDIERVAFIARLALACDYIDEAEATKILKQARKLAEENFSDWWDYLASFIKGRCLVLPAQNDDNRWAMHTAYTDGLLLEEKKWGDVWAWSPLNVL